MSNDPVNLLITFKVEQHKEYELTIDVKKWRKIVGRKFDIATVTREELLKYQQDVQSYASLRNEAVVDEQLVQVEMEL